jgi:hypothetical protein
MAYATLGVPNVKSLKFICGQTLSAIFTRNPRSRSRSINFPDKRFELFPLRFRNYRHTAVHFIPDKPAHRNPLCCRRHRKAKTHALYAALKPNRPTSGLHKSIRTPW